MIWFSRNTKLILPVCFLLLFGFGQEGLAKDGPIAQFASEHLDLGRIQQGKTPEGYFTLQNIGDETLIVEKIEASCGCTAAIIDNKKILPGNKAKIKITIDTTGKELDIDKTVTITSNDSLRPQMVLTVAVRVEPVEHPDFDIGESLFSYRCKSCHVDSGKGLMGRGLYEAICYQCHGRNGKGATAVAFDTQEYSEHSYEYIYKWTAQGKRGTGMAGYSKEHGGPLTNEEIDSLVKFIQQLSISKKEN